MTRIFKFPLADDDVQDIEMPAGSVVLTLQAQRDVPCIWAIVEPDAPKMKRRFRTYATGEPMEDERQFPQYIGTYQLQGGALVFHVFSDGKEYPK